MRRWPAGAGSTKRTLARELLHRLNDLRCPCCRAPFPLERLTKHHIVPRSKGGPSTLENLVLICRPCHDEIHRDAGGAAATTLARFLAGREHAPFPPPPDPVSPEEAIRWFLHAAGVQATRVIRQRRFSLNPPFDPYWPVGRYVSLHAPLHGDDGMGPVATQAAMA